MWHVHARKVRRSVAAIESALAVVGRHVVRIDPRHLGTQLAQALAHGARLVGLQHVVAPTPPPRVVPSSERRPVGGARVALQHAPLLVAARRDHFLRQHLTRRVAAVLCGAWRGGLSSCES
eukprot:957424-Prymnesium_polylepis.2